MQQDTRHLTVALEHLRAAYEELGMAQNLTERSMAESAARRALDHLDLSQRRLETQRQRDDRQELQDAFDHARWAWQDTHTLLNDWPNAVSLTLDTIRERVRESVRLVELLLPEQQAAAA